MTVTIEKIENGYLVHVGTTTGTKQYYCDTVDRVNDLVKRTLELISESEG